MLDKMTFCNFKPNVPAFGKSNNTIEFGNQTLSIDGKNYWCFLDKNGIRDFAYEYESDVGKRNFKRKGGTKTVTCKMHSVDCESIRNELNKLSYLVDNQFDMMNSYYPTSYLVIGECYAEVRLVEVKFSDYLLDDYHTKLEFTFLSDDWVWYKDTVISYDPNLYANIEDFWRDYNGNGKRGYNYGYGGSGDYESTIHPSLVNVANNSTAHVELYLYGLFDNPYIMFNGLKKGITGRLSEGDDILLSTRNKSVTLFKSNGNQENIFSRRLKDSYFSVFRKLTLPCNITVPRGLKFSLVISEERGSPLWT